MKIFFGNDNFRNRIHSWLSKTYFGFILELVIIVFAVVGIVFSLVFAGMQFGVFNVRGSIDNRNEFYNVAKEEASTDANLLLIEKIQAGFRKDMKVVRKSVFPDVSFAWIDTAEWNTLSIALTKDREVIRKAAEDASISPRILVSVIIAEQIRFFTSNRESYKKFFEPLKILGTLSQFSLGVSGIKPETAKLIEENLKNPNSQFYISKEYENLLDYKDSNIDINDSVSTEINIENGTRKGTSTDGIYGRLTDDHNHYYSYLYTALFIKEIESQWKREGYDISNRPEILATIFNLGFDKSIPKKDPETAGSIIEIGGEKISFGRLSYEFFYSGELLDIFGF